MKPQNEVDPLISNKNFFLTSSSLNMSDKLQRHQVNTTKNSCVTHLKLQNSGHCSQSNDKTVVRNDFDTSDMCACTSNNFEINSNVLRFRSDVVPIEKPSQWRDRIPRAQNNSLYETKPMSDFNPQRDELDNESADGYNTIGIGNVLQTNQVFHKPSYKVKPLKIQKHEKKTRAATDENIHNFDSNFSFRPNIDTNTATITSSKSMLNEAKEKLEVFNSFKMTDSAKAIDSSYLYDLLDTCYLTQHTKF